VKEKETDLYNSIGDTTGLSKKERAELIKRAKQEAKEAAMRKRTEEREAVEKIKAEKFQNERKAGKHKTLAEITEGKDDYEQDFKVPEGVVVYCENLIKLYKVGDIEVMALQGLDLSVKDGEMVAIIGNSGSGKSTLMNIIGGLDRPTAGRIYVNGINLLKLDDNQMLQYMRETVGFVWQNTARNMIPYLNALDNVKLVMQMAGRLDSNRANELLEIVGLEHRKKSKMHELSGGEQQRVAIAIGLANNPRILLADEPTGAVDTKTTAQIMSVFHKLNTEMGVTVIIVTHDRQLSHMVPRVVTISDGRIGTEFIRREEIDVNSDEMMNATAGHDSGSHIEYGFIDGRRRLFIPEYYLSRVGLHEKCKVGIDVKDDRLELFKPEDDNIK
jgi:ABC-type lipoprotein export system ATPase subunit